VWEERTATGGYRSEEIVVINEDGFPRLPNTLSYGETFRRHPGSCGPEPGGGAAQMGSTQPRPMVLGRLSQYIVTSPEPAAWG